MDDDQLGETAKEILKQADNGDSSVVIPTIVLAEAMFISENTGGSFQKLLDKLESGSNYESYPLNMKGNQSNEQNERRLLHS